MATVKKKPEEGGATVVAAPSPPPAAAAEQAPVAPAAPKAVGGVVACTVTTGIYIADRVYQSGETVLVPVEEVAKLAHCLTPVE